MGVTSRKEMNLNGTNCRSYMYEAKSPAFEKHFPYLQMRHTISQKLSFRVQTRFRLFYNLKRFLKTN